MTNFVYLLRCKDNTLYCGYTNNLENRVKVHNLGKGSKYTRGRIPVKLVYVEKFSSKSSALKREYAIKQFSKNDKEELIKSKTRFFLELIFF